MNDQDPGDEDSCGCTYALCGKPDSIHSNDLPCGWCNVTRRKHPVSDPYYHTWRDNRP